MCLELKYEVHIYQFDFIIYVLFFFLLVKNHVEAIDFIISYNIQINYLCIDVKYKEIMKIYSQIIHPIFANYA